MEFNEARDVGVAVASVRPCANRYWAFSLPGQFASQSESGQSGRFTPWPTRFLALSLPGPFDP